MHQHTCTHTHRVPALPARHATYLVLQVKLGTGQYQIVYYLATSAVSVDGQHQRRLSILMAGESKNTARSEESMAIVIVSHANLLSHLVQQVKIGTSIYIILSTNSL